MPTYKCNKCMKEFKRADNYKRHLNKKKPCKDVNIHKCKNCDKTFSRLDNYNRHLKTVCNKNTICIYCSKKFSTKYSCERHQKKTCKSKKEAQIVNTIINNNDIRVNNNDKSIALIPTDLPEPVVPATRR